MARKHRIIPVICSAAGGISATQGSALMASEVPADVPEWVMIARTGEWRGHPAGPQAITGEKLNAALDHFSRHYAAHDKSMVIDYQHASVFAARYGQPQAPAAGWIGAMELRAGGTELWGRVQWNDKAREAIADREWRYLSPVLMFDRPDRVSGEPVPLYIHSVALTNTPFLTELEALNSNPATDGGVQIGPENGRNPMGLLAMLCTAIGMEPGEVASALGLEDPEAEDRKVAEAIMRCSERPAEPVVNELLPEGVANALGVDPGAEETDVRAKIIALKAGGGAPLARVCSALGLEAGADGAQPPGAEMDAVLEAIRELRRDHRKNAAEALVDEAVEAGKVPPAETEFWLNAAEADLDATRRAIEALPVLTEQAGERPNAETGGTRELTEAEAIVCSQLGLTTEQFLAQQVG